MARPAERDEVVRAVRKHLRLAEQSSEEATPLDVKSVAAATGYARTTLYKYGLQREIQAVAEKRSRMETASAAEQEAAAFHPGITSPETCPVCGAVDECADPPPKTIQAMPNQPIPMIRGVYQTSTPYRNTLTPLGYKPTETSLSDNHPYNARCIGWTVEVQLDNTIRNHTASTLPEAYDGLIQALREENLPAPSVQQIANAATDLDPAPLRI